MGDDFLDFDVVSPWHGSAQDIKFGQNVSLEQLAKGTVIETPEEDSNEAADNESDWWTKDELLEHIKETHVPSLMDSASWEEKIPTMEPLVENQVYKKVMKSGYGPVLKKKNAVLFHCNGYSEGSDEPFDSSVLRGRPILHRLDREDLLPGLMVGILSMRMAEKAEILIKPEYAFGELGCPPRIPGNSTIIYIVEILRVFEEGSLADYELMTPEEMAAVPFPEIIQKCNEQRMSGNSYFSAERYREAAMRYSKAIKFLEKYFYKDTEEQKAGHEILSKLYPNNANALIRLKKLRPAMVCCRKALQIDPNNVKALCQYGKAKFNNGEYDVAKMYFTRAYALKPGDTYVGQYLVRINEKLLEDERISRNLYRKMGESLVQSG
ncbi:inactive peptidyl-prolyl cis-trans isomerase FKBP6 [Tetranychus urticae]|uniref:peptidylprolyl isomerase n=1 Tax=Tetranychus urticae TaxID=32264 RepID=T1K3B5_TETUR|nr:inactive peptidyl-prolyl cis-trans isomerase FKBP6 [Tetranychus urticae]